MVKGVSQVPHRELNCPSLPSSLVTCFAEVLLATQPRDAPKHPRHTFQAIPRAPAGPRPGPEFQEPPKSLTFAAVSPSIPTLKLENRCGGSVGSSEHSLAALVAPGTIPLKDPNFTLQSGNRDLEKKGGLPRPPPSWRQPSAST